MPFSNELIAAIGAASAGRLAKAARHWSALWGFPGLFDEILIRRNCRLTRTVARHDRVKQVVEVGEPFFRLSSRRAEVLCHELAHACVDRMAAAAKAKTHGREWASLMRLAGYQPSAKIILREQPRKVAAPIVRRASRVYAHRCPICQVVRTAHRPMRSWGCSFCAASGEEGRLVMERWK
jgi:hypothetical protein